MATLVMRPPADAVPAGDGTFDIVAEYEEAALEIIRSPLGGGYVPEQIAAAVVRACRSDLALAALAQTLPRVCFTLGQAARIPGAIPAVWRFPFRVYLIKSAQ